MERPTTEVEAKTGQKFTLYTYLTIGEKREILQKTEAKSATDIAAGIGMQERTLAVLLVSPKWPIDGWDEMPSVVGDVLLNYATRVFDGKNGLGSSTK